MKRLHVSSVSMGALKGGGEKDHLLGRWVELDKAVLLFRFLLSVEDKGLLGVHIHSVQGVYLARDRDLEEVETVWGSSGWAVSC